ncbi:MAG: hypothetical protein J6K20_06860 [Thermoguttaceae bacterium]|nr:hypothetical protein [Thermoguttaceae bacterium]
MVVRELKARYGVNSNTAKAFSWAIRSKIPGGDGWLDALDLIGRLPKRDENVQVILYLRNARAEIENVIAERYELRSAQNLELTEMK